MNNLHIHFHDAGFDEGKIKRDEDGKFAAAERASSKAHSASAKANATSHTAQHGAAISRRFHREAANLHGVAAKAHADVGNRGRAREHAEIKSDHHRKAVMTPIQSVAQIPTATMEELLKTFNKLTGLNITRFASRADGEQRVAWLLPPESSEGEVNSATVPASMEKAEKITKVKNGKAAMNGLKFFYLR